MQNGLKRITHTIRTGKRKNDAKKRKTLQTKMTFTSSIHTLVGSYWLGDVTSGVRTAIINTSYQKLPFGSGDDPDKLFLHQAVN